MDGVGHVDVNNARGRGRKIVGMASDCGERPNSCISHFLTKYSRDPCPLMRHFECESLSVPFSTGEHMWFKAWFEGSYYQIFENHLGIIMS